MKLELEKGECMRRKFGWKICGHEKCAANIQYKETVTSGRSERIERRAVNCSRCQDVK